jgi:hypothetical protein
MNHPPLKIYLSSSWKLREQVRKLAIRLRNAGCEVHDFTDPACRKSPEIPPEMYPEVFDPEKHNYFDYLNQNPNWRAAVTDNQRALRWCDVVVLMLPCGNDAHADWAFAIGAGKKTCVLGHPWKGDRIPSHLWADAFFKTEEEVVAWLSPELRFVHPMPEERLVEIEQIHRAGGDEDVDHDTRAHCHRGELIEEVRRLRTQSQEVSFVVNQTFPGLAPDKVAAEFKKGMEEALKHQHELRPLYVPEVPRPGQRGSRARPRRRSTREKLVRAGAAIMGIPLKAFCDFCDCESCLGGREDLTHAATADGRWICDVCYDYDLCTGANRHVQRAHSPCEDKNCAHRPRLISAFVPKLECIASKEPA